MKKVLSILFIYISCYANAQYFPPAAGQVGTTAIHRDSANFIAWAEECTVVRGYINISDTNIYVSESNRASFGSEENALGIADNQVVSLGDGGVATLHFSQALVDNNGFDFAVFENSFNDSFLELAFVEVSTNGTDYIRFPATSNTPYINQIGSFGEIEAVNINNLAGKYRVLYGTPFDLSTLSDSSGIDINNIHYIRIIDVIGSINQEFASYDHNGNIINDPWPTPFATSGFDLDAVGILGSQTSLPIPTKADIKLTVNNNPSFGEYSISSSVIINAIEVFRMDGTLLYRIDYLQDAGRNEYKLNISHYNSALYFLKIFTIKGMVSKTVVKY